MTEALVLNIPPCQGDCARRAGSCAVQVGKFRTAKQKLPSAEHKQDSPAIDELGHLQYHGIAANFLHTLLILTSLPQKALGPPLRRCVCFCFL